jgi:hypothetical protein
MSVVERELEPMRFHGPGWTLDLTIRDERGNAIERGPLYQLWAPQDSSVPDPYIEFQSSPGYAPRMFWAAAWQSADGHAGGFVRGATAEIVLVIFDPKLRAKFHAVACTDGHA